MGNKNGVVEAMQFMVVPIVKRDREVVKVLLDQSQLWSYEMLT